MADLSANGFDDILFNELANLEKVQHQNPDTGAGINAGTSFVDQYTNNIFGAPFQLMDSVDKRFSTVNKYVGNEYLRNFILNSPILHIKPGLPKYTGDTSGSKIIQSIKELYVDTSEGMDFTEAFLTQLAGGTVFSVGSKLQKRMFGFRETYHTYMSYVNYMCRSMATFLNLTNTEDNNYKFPTGTFINGGDGNMAFAPFESIKWENYRMLSKSKPLSPLEQLEQMGGATLLGSTIGSISSVVSSTIGLVGSSAKSTAELVTKSLYSDTNDAVDEFINKLTSSTNEEVEKTKKDISDYIGVADSERVMDSITNKVTSVMFMVEPTSFEETLSNGTRTSIVESAADTARSTLGSELAFITGSNVDKAALESLTSFLGDTVEVAGNLINNVAEGAHLTGGFTSNLFQGAMGSVKGQKMIYPKIFDSSESTCDYSFTVNLSSPYGDIYNYYMNIVVPLMHLIALASPRMVTANSVSSPFLVQAFIPGMCTCQLGIIKNMTIRKNPNVKHVSAQGYPLDISVTFTIEELYNALAISPANDPASFMYNETLNDYMSNLAGLQPAVDTYTNQRKAAFAALENYLANGEAQNDLANSWVMKFEDFVNPFSAR